MFREAPPNKSTIETFLIRYAMAELQEAEVKALDAD